MRRLAVVTAALAAAACLDFDTSIAQCRAGGGPCAGSGGAGGGSAGGGGGGAADAGPICFNGFCWLNPTPTGDDFTAVGGTSEDDVWVGGAAGLVLHWDGRRWEPRRLGAPPQPSTGENMVFTVLCTASETLIAGAQLAPRLWTGTGWSNEAFTPGSSYGVRQLVAAGGSPLAVGGTDRGVLLARRTGGSGLTGWTVSLTEDGGEATAATDEPDPVVAITWGGGAQQSAALRFLDGGTLTTLPSVGYGVTALTHMGGADFWVGGTPGLYRVVGADAGDDLDPGTYYAHGVWLPQANASVLVTSGDLIREGRDSLTGTTINLPGAGYNDVWAAPDGGAVIAVGPGGLVVRRAGPGAWATNALGTNCDVHGHLVAALATPDGGALIGGDQGVLLHVGQAGLDVVNPPSPVTSRWAALWLDGTRVLAADGDGNVCVDFGNCQAPGGPVRGGVGTLAVGDDGGVYLLAAGGWSRVAAPRRDFTGAALAASRTFLTDSSGAISELAAGVVRQVFDAGVPLDAVAGLPSGELYAVGAANTLVSGTADGGFALHPVNLGVYGPSGLHGVCAFGPGDAWAVGDSGAVWHWSAGARQYVESGTRSNLFSVACVTSGATRRLVISGALGAVLVKQL